MMTILNANLWSKVLLLSTVCSLTACVDDRYDLSKEIDLTIEVGGKHLAIPVGSTEPMSVSQLLDITGNTLVHADEAGDYYLTKEGESVKGSFNIAPFHITRPAPVTMQTEISSFKEIHFPTGIVFRVQIPNELQGAATFTAHHLPKELLAVQQLQVQLTSRTTLHFTPGFCKRIKLIGVYIQYPRYIISEQLDAQNRLFIPDTDLAEGKSITQTIHITGIDLTKTANKGVVKDGSLSISNKIEIHGDIELKSDDVYDGQTPKIQLIGQADITAGEDANEPIKVTHVQASIQPQVQLANEVFDLKDVPDFLEDKDVRLDIKNPILFAEIKNNTPLDATLHGQVTAYDAQQEVMAQVALTSPLITNTTLAKFAFSPVNTPQIQGYTHVSQPTLPTLIAQVPHSLAIKATISTSDAPMDIQLGRQYDYEAHYHLLVPFTFGPKLVLAYRDTLNGWHDEIKDLSLKGIEVTGDFVNKVPLGLVLSAQAIDQQGRIIPGIKIDVKTDLPDGRIAPLSSQEAVTSHFTITMIADEPSIIHLLDGITILAKADSKELEKEATLNAKQTVQITNMKAKALSNITLDLND